MRSGAPANGPGAGFPAENAATVLYGDPLNAPGIVLSNVGVDGADIRPQGFTAIAGHGHYNDNDGYFFVPEGTSLTLHAPPGSNITDTLGQAIETGHLDGIQDPYTRTYGPGDRIPNLTINPGIGLKISSTSVTVTAPTLLSDILRPEMGRCDLATCTGGWNDGPGYRDGAFFFENPGTPFLDSKGPRPTWDITGGYVGDHDEKVIYIDGGLMTTPHGVELKDVVGVATG